MMIATKHSVNRIPTEIINSKLATVIGDLYAMRIT